MEVKRNRQRHRTGQARTKTGEGKKMGGERRRGSRRR